MTVAGARLSAGRQFWRWIVDDCPFRDCKDRGHVHGGGLIAEDPRKMLGHRSHFGHFSGYSIVDGDPKRSAVLIESVRGGRQSERRGKLPR